MELDHQPGQWTQLSPTSTLPFSSYLIPPNRFLRSKFWSRHKVLSSTPLHQPITTLSTRWAPRPDSSPPASVTVIFATTTIVMTNWKKHWCRRFDIWQMHWDLADYRIFCFIRLMSFSRWPHVFCRVSCAMCQWQQGNYISKTMVRFSKLFTVRIELWRQRQVSSLLHCAKKG